MFLLRVGLTVLMMTSCALAQGVQKSPVTSSELQKVKPGPRAIVRVVPVTGTGSRPSDYCRLNRDGLVVRLKNIGGLQAPQQTVIVTFRTSAGSQRNTKRSSVIPPNRSVDVVFRTPNGWCSLDCSFSIRRSNQPIIKGFCVG
jgi:hypothetical protein